MSDDAKLRTAAGLSDVWDGSPIRRVRSGDGVSVLAGRRLSAHLMAQPAVADILFRDPLLAEQGLLVPASRDRARPRLGNPPVARRAAGDGVSHPALRRTHAEHFRPPAAAAPRHDERAGAALDRPVRVRAAGVDRVSPIMSSERSPRTAASMPSAGWRTSCPSMRRGSRPCSRSSRTSTPKRSAKAKSRPASPLRTTTASRPCGCSGAPRSTSDLRLAQSLLDWLLGTWSEPYISLPDIYQRSLNAIGDKATAARLVEILEDHGWLKKMPAGAVVSGQQRRDAWLIVRG